jgi:hypothetical protein
MSPRQEPPFRWYEIFGAAAVAWLLGLTITYVIDWSGDVSPFKFFMGMTAGGLGLLSAIGVVTAIAAFVEERVNG